MFKSTFPAVALTLSLITPAFAHDFKVGDLEIKHPWSRATTSQATSGAGYMTIVNTGTTPDRLLSASTSIATAEIHETIAQDGVMRMREIEAGLEIIPGAEIMLAPGAAHVMLMGLTGPLVEGESFDALLTFEQAGTITVTFKIDAFNAGLSDSAPSEMNHDDMDHDADHSGH